MNKSVVELIVGVVFAAGILVLGAYTIVLSGVHLGSTKRFIVDFERVYGLKKGDAVRVEGYEKGEVKSLRLLSGGKIRAELEVQADVEIYKQNSDVRVTPFSPLGGRVVEIKRGIKDTPRGKYLSYGAAGDVGSPEEADVIVGTAEGELLQTLNALVSDNRESVDAIVENLKKVSIQLTRTDNALGYLLNSTDGAKKIQSVADGMASAAQRIDRILARVERGEGVIGGLVEDDSKLHKNVDQALDSGRDSLQSLSKILKRADDGKSALGVLVSDDPTVTAATKGIVTDVKTVTGKIASGKGTLGKFVHDDKLYDGAANTAKNLDSITAKIDSGKGLLGVLLEKEAGDNARKTLENLGEITDAINDPEGGTIGLLVHDAKLRRRLVRITEEIEGLVTEFRDSLEDVREQAPVNAFIGAVFSAF